MDCGTGPSSSSRTLDGECCGDAICRTCYFAGMGSRRSTPARYREKRLVDPLKFATNGRRNCTDSILLPKQPGRRQQIRTESKTITVTKGVGVVSDLRR